MPIFEYKCGECGSNFEMFLKSRDEEKDLECLNCRSKNVKKQFSTFHSNLKDDGASKESKCHSCPVQGCPNKKLIG
jgi:putative FmdB family regulatory protein